VDLVRNRHIRPQAIHLKMEKRTLEGKVLEDDGTVVDPIPAWVVLIHVGLGDGDGVGDVVQSDIVVFDVLGDTLSADPRLKVGGGQCAGRRVQYRHSSYLEPSPVQGVDHRNILYTHQTGDQTVSNESFLHTVNTFLSSPKVISRTVLT
jgi:hypothetical protein